MLYKYRSLSNLQFALDIIVNKRMFAAKFQDLNDPMEGVYKYHPEALNQQERNMISGNKNEYRLLSLSETLNNMLMWSYYAESHKGMIVCVSVTDPEAKVVPVEYVDDITIDMSREDVAKGILTKKFRLWEHEREHRAFVRGKSFIKVAVEELIFGVKANKDLKELITKIAKNCDPNIKVRTLRQDELHKGNRDAVDALQRR